MSLAVLIMQIQGQLKNLQVVRDLQGQGIYHYSWVAVEVTIMRPCIDFEDKTGCGPTIAGQMLMKKSPFSCPRLKEEHYGDFQSSGYRNITVLLGIISWMILNWLLKTSLSSWLIQKRIRTKRNGCRFLRKQSKVKPFSHLALAKLPLQHFCFNQKCLTNKYKYHIDHYKNITAMR